MTLGNDLWRLREADPATGVTGLLGAVRPLGVLRGMARGG